MSNCRCGPGELCGFCAEEQELDELIADPRRVTARPLAVHHEAAADMTAVPEADWSALLAVATLYVSAFTDDELMTLPEKLRLQEVEDILKRHGRRY